MNLLLGIHLLLSFFLVSNCFWYLSSAVCPDFSPGKATKHGNITVDLTLATQTIPSDMTQDGRSYTVNFCQQSSTPPCTNTNTWTGICAVKDDNPPYIRLGDVYGDWYLIDDQNPNAGVKAILGLGTYVYTYIL